MSSSSDLSAVEKIEKIDVGACQKLAEGKTKIIYQLPKYSNYVLIQSKDKITAFNAERQHQLEGKAKLSNVATCRVFQYLKHVGFPTHFVKQLSETEFLSRKCDMIPIEWVTRRVATGSFLKRNEGVPEGFRFAPPKMEMFFKDDAKGDPQWSEEMLLSSKMEIGGVLIGKNEIRLMADATVIIFELLERAWTTLGCSLIDMKIEFGVLTETGEIVLADVIDNDSWRLWPNGDKRLQLDKQFYRDLPVVTEKDLKQLKENFAAVIEKLDKFVIPPKGRVVVIAGSKSDETHCLKIRQTCESLGIPCLIRYCSAHKDTHRTLELAKEYEGDAIPTVFIAVAGMSNGLGPVLAGNLRSPVINCPPGIQESPNDIWSSVNLPSGLFCCTILSPGNAAGHAASILAQNDHVIWSRLATKQFLNIKLGLDNDKEVCLNVCPKKP